MAWAAETIGLFGRGLRLRNPPGDSERFVRPHNLMTLLADSLRLYAEYWLVLAGIYFLPAFALAILNRWIGYESTGIWPMIYILLSILLLGPLTVAVSEACLGVPPRVMRTYRRVSGRVFLRLLGAVAIQLLMMFSGAAVILVFIAEIDTLLGGSVAQKIVLTAILLGPAVVFGAWYMFIQPAIVLDHCSLLKSFRRSHFLGRGYCLRNLIHALSIGIALLLIGWLGRLLLDRIPRPTRLPDWLTEVAEVTVQSLPGLILTPIVSIALVLLYYDLRVRKEGFGLEQLEQELHD